MEFYSADIEMLMSGWNTLYILLSYQKNSSDPATIPDLLAGNGGPHSS
jgi:hypothetical protein